MNRLHPAFAVFPPIERHGVIGDRRTGALVAADGTVDWFCVPNFDCVPIFGALLDPERGGYFRVGPKETRLGEQHYLESCATLVTTWSAEGIEIADVMAWPHDEPPAEAHGKRVILRRLSAIRNTTVCLELEPRRDFREMPHAREKTVFQFADGALGLWASFPVESREDGAYAQLVLKSGEEHWIAIGWNLDPSEWAVKRAVETFASAGAYWTSWCAGLKIKHGGEREAALRRAAITVQLLSSSRDDSALAALTTSLPERIRGDRNYDYRCAWVRDASLSLAMLARMGKEEEVQRYLEWLCELESDVKCPLKVCYRFDGSTVNDEEEVPGVRGYRDSRPVHRGNRAVKQIQYGSLGFLMDCVRIYFDEGGPWEEHFWHLLQRVASYVTENWQNEDNGIWELVEKTHHVASRVMCWVVLERASHIARKTGHDSEAGRWLRAAEDIHAEVMAKGWCESKRSFRQRYGSDALDAATLLIPLMEFLPIDHPCVVDTVTALERELVVDGLLHRFNPKETPGGGPFSVSEFEGAFLPCVFWHAHVLAKMGRCEAAEAILVRCEKVAGELGIFAEEIDAKAGTFLGNTPLLFAHVEYVRAVVELNKARQRTQKKANL